MSNQRTSSEQVKTNLRAGKIRLVFVADVLPAELRRIIEFLNEQTDPLEVLGVEVRQYVAGDKRTIVPRVVGRTTTAEQKKSVGRPKRKWNEAAFFEQLGEHGADAVRRGRRLLEWANNEGLRVWFGEGTITGSFIPLLDLPGGKAAYSFSAWTNGRVAVEFVYMGRSGRYATEEERLPLLGRLNALPGIDLPSANGEPSFRLSELPDDQVLEGFLTIWDEYVAEFRHLT